MAWKLKRSKTEEDEPKTKGLKPGNDGDESDFEHKPGAFEPVGENYDSGAEAQDRTVMLLTDDNYLPGYIPSSLGNGNGNHDDLPHVATAHPMDLDDEDYISSALTSSDAALSALNAAKAVPPGISHIDIDPPRTEDFDADAFAPYQAPTNGSSAVHDFDLDSSPLEMHDLDAAPVIAPPPPPAPKVPAPVAVAPAPVAPIFDEPLSSPIVAPRLVVRLGQFSASYEVTKPEVTIGRPDPRMDMFPDVSIEWDDAVSRNHARLIHGPDGDFIEDTGSTNGTKLNDKPLAPNKPLPLKDGDRITLGEKTEIAYLR